MASAVTGACGQLCTLDVSKNKIGNDGLAALERALKPPFTALDQLRVIDLSDNKDTSQPARKRVLDARRGPRPTGEDGGGKQIKYELSPSHQFRIVAAEKYPDDR